MSGSPTNKNLVAAIIAGGLSSALFLTVFGIGLGFLFMFLPTLPLFFLGLGQTPRMATLATFIAFVVISLIAGIPAAIMFLLFLGLPACYIAHQSLFRKSRSGVIIWYPIGLIVIRLALYASALLALITWYYAGENGGLQHIISQNIQDTFADLKDDYGDFIDMMAGELSFSILPITVWLWAMMLYAHAWMANRALVKNHKQVRPDFRVERFAMPGWVLGLLAICGLASLIGSESMSFLGKTSLICLLLPYFFSGAAILHAHSKSFASPRFFLFFMYFMVFALFWPALIVSAVGLFDQIKHLSAPDSWFKS